MRGCSAAFYLTKSQSGTRPQGLQDATRCHRAIAYNFDGVSGFQQTRSTLLFPTAALCSRNARPQGARSRSNALICPMEVFGAFCRCWCSITLRKRNVPLENGKCSDRFHRCSDVRPPCSSSVLIPTNGPNVKPVQLLSAQSPVEKSTTCNEPSTSDSTAIKYGPDILVTTRKPIGSLDSPTDQWE